MDPASWLQHQLDTLANHFPDDSYFSYGFNLRALLAVLLVSLICGAVSSLVVGNRMAFFSDALAHCAFAGVALGLLIGYLVGALAPEGFYSKWGITLIMVVFGSLVGLGIVYVAERTKLASDTVIGVFFAGAIGFGAMILSGLARFAKFEVEGFLFGDVATVSGGDLLVLAGLTVLTALLLGWLYNYLVLTSFNPTLARSRRVPVRLCSYLLILLLALIVNICLKTVGALLINALLIVPAATAANLSRNMRQVFWWTTGLCLTVCLGGLLLSWEVRIPSRAFPDRPLTFGTGGMIVVLSVVLFFVSMVVPSRLVRGAGRTLSRWTGNNPLTSNNPSPPTTGEREKMG